MLCFLFYENRSSQKFLKSRYYEGKKYPRSPPDIFSIIKEGSTK